MYSPGSNSSCMQYSEDGAEIVYKITLPANTTVQISMTPSSDYDVALYVITSCGDVTAENSCVAGADEALEGGEETLTITNNSSQEQVYYVVADTYGDSSSCGSFDLSITPQ